MKHPEYAALRRSAVTIDASSDQGPLECWRHSLGQGGINTTPLPPPVVAGVRHLKPRLVRIFIQEFFRIYPERGKFDWSRLDPYMDALAATGAKIVAALTIKPPTLFPRVDHATWQPQDEREWQTVISEMVHRYSVQRPLVTHWEIGNETDIGESGGAPYLIPDPVDYTAYYRSAVQAIHSAFPAARVGGPAACWIDNEPLPGFVAHCRAEGLPLHFVSWHLYSDDPGRHQAGVEKARKLLTNFPEPRPEMMVTEWSKGFDSVSIPELALEPRRAAITAAAILAMMDAGLDWSFYYHIWDQVCYPDQFQPFFSPNGVQGMVRHWNEVPHRFALFDLAGSPRPQYFVYHLLGQMGSIRISGETDCKDLRVLAGRSDRSVSALVVNTRAPGADAEDCILEMQFQNLPAGPGQFSVYRIDGEQRWTADPLALQPVETRPVALAGGSFRCQVYSPAESVLLASFEEVDESGGST